MTNDFDSTTQNSTTQNSTTPVNRPGLPALGYRISDYATVRSRFLSRLSRLVPDRPLSLRQLTTRSPF
jgi:hypothetical protein